MRRLAIALLFLCVWTALGATYYVDPSGDGSDGLSLATAYKTLGAAKASAHDGDTVYIGTGTYHRFGTTLWSNNVIWKSLGGPTTVIITNILDGNFTLFTSAGTYDGLTFRGNTNGANGMIGLVNGTINFTNCILRNNDTLNYGSEGSCIRSYTTAATGNLYNCIINSNRTGNDVGGAIYVDDTCTFNLFNCVLSHNSAGAGNDGGVVYVVNSGVFNAYGCIFSNNSCGRDGSVGWWGTTAGGILSNCTVAYNTAGRYSALNRGSAYNCLFYGNSDGNGIPAGFSTRFWSCSIFGNYGGAGDGGGLYGAVYQGVLSNCLVWFNYPKDVDGVVAVNTCYGKKGTAGGAGTYTASITNNPLTVDDYTAVPTNTNTGASFSLGAGGIAGFKLQAASPCINTGTNQAWMVGALDLAGDARIYDTYVDMGAYEYSPTAPPASGGQRWKGVVLE